MSLWATQCVGAIKKVSAILPHMRNLTNNDLGGMLVRSSAEPSCPVRCAVSCSCFPPSEFVVELGKVWGGGNSYIKRH